ncbi:MAG: roadblock/LC7 domain-containing protein [Promethearchaeota archaeon]
MDSIKSISGVENVVLTQRDGNPITSSGVWLSKNEIFNVSAATSAIYNVGLTLHGEWLKYMIIEGPKAKIMIAPLQSYGQNEIGQKNTNISAGEYFIALTTLSHVNLGSMFIKTQNTLKNINNIICKSNESFKPPLREFNEKQIGAILEKFNSKDDNEEEIQLMNHSMGLNLDTYRKCEDILWNFQKMVPNLIYSSVAFKGGFILNSIQPSSNFNLTPDNETAMSFSLFDTSSRYAWLLKKMNINSIFLDCNHYMHFIMGFEEGIFSSYIFSNNQRIGFIRLLLPKYLGLIKNILSDAARFEYSLDARSQEILSPLMIR